MSDVWPPGTATGLGPFPGDDPLEAARIVCSELPELPFLPQLPARGVGADPVGRTAGLLADLHVEVGTGAWRFVPRPGRDEQRAHAHLISDLDAYEEVAQGHHGAAKLGIVGPWTLAASIELTRGEKALADPGAVRDIAASLAEGLTRHLSDVRRRLPGLGRLVVQVDEPVLPAVLEGRVPTASGWGRLRTYERAVVEDGLRQVLGALSHVPAPVPVGGDGGTNRPPGGDPPDGHATPDIAGVWVGGAGIDGALLRAAGAAFVGIDGAGLDSVDEDALGEAVDAGLGLLVACVPLATTPPDPRPVVAPVRAVWKRLGFAAGLLPRTVALAPDVGLEQLDVGAVPAVLRRVVEASRHLEEAVAEEEP